MSGKESPNSLSHTRSGKNGSKKKKKPVLSKLPGPGPSASVQSLTLDLGRTPFFPPELPALRISRNKHWRYVSSFHGPWLSLPLEMLESLLVSGTSPMPLTMDASLPKSKRRRVLDLVSHLPSQSSSMTLRAAPPPIQPGVFRNVVSIRRLMDEAGELAMRASGGIVPSGQLCDSHGPMGAFLQGSGRGGRKVPMSNVRSQRLRALAVQKVSQAYLLDEIVTSVMVMKGTSTIDDLAAIVLKSDPNNIDAQYVNFFHEKVPSRSPRQICETDTSLLDQLITARSNQLEYWRTRGIVHTFRGEFSDAIKDFTYGLNQSRAIRKARHDAESESSNDLSKITGKGKTRWRSTVSPSPGEEADNASASDNPIFPVDGASGVASTFSSTPREHYPSSLPDAPEPLELQFLFQRGVTHLMHACSCIERAILQIEVLPTPPPEGPDIYLSRLDYLLPKYGGVEISNPAGPLGPHDGKKSLAYQAMLNDSSFRDSVYTMLRKAIRDLERYLSHFDSIISPEVLTKAAAFETSDRSISQDKGKQKAAMKHGGHDTKGVPTRGWEDLTLEEQVDFAYFMIESLRPSTTSGLGSPLPERLTYLASSFPVTYTSYHPLLVESHFSVLICYLLLGEMQTVCHRFIQTAIAMDGFDGHPIFLPSRSMAQADFGEVLERLVGGWRCGLLPPSASWRAAGARGSSEPRREIGFGEPSSSTVQSLRCDGTESNDMADTSDASEFESLVALRMLMAPVWRRQREKRGSRTAPPASSATKSGGIPVIALHGPRVDIILAWLGAVHLPKLEAAEAKAPRR